MNRKLVIDHRRELYFQAAQITRPLHHTFTVYLHLVSEGIRFKMGGRRLKKKKHTVEIEKNVRLPSFESVPLRTNSRILAN